MSMVSLSEIGRQIAEPTQPTGMSLDTVQGFESMQRAAKLFSSSSIVPAAYKGNMPNCFIAVDMALRMGANPLLVMQNLYIVHGNPAWSAQFLIATFNKSGKFSALRYEFQGTEGKDDWGCRAVATELATKEKLYGPLVTIAMAKKEGWEQKSGSKWQSMPEQMLRYRAAAWFVRVYAPEIAMGLRTREEEEDRVIEVEATTSMSELQDEASASESSEETPEEEPVEIIEEEPKKKKSTVRQCPKEGPDGLFRTVKDSDCQACPDKTGCPALE